MDPSFAARGSVRHVFASTFAFALAILGVVVLGIGIVVGPAGAVLGIATIGGLAWLWWRLPRRRLVVDAPGPDARLRHGIDGRDSLLLADVAGGVVHRTAGTTYRGIRAGADVERWLLVSHDGRSLGRVDGRGFSADDLLTARQRIGGTWMSLADARHRGLLPADAPWDMRRPGPVAALVVGSVLATIAVLVGVGVAVSHVGRAALLWPWWS